MFPFLLNLLGKLFQSYYIRLRMCTATASVDRIELHPESDQLNERFEE